VHRASLPHRPSLITAGHGVVKAVDKHVTPRREDCLKNARTDAPTPAPTTAPASAPTATPATAPTAAPTDAPTAAPTSLRIKGGGRCTPYADEAVIIV
jgi:hypothetical protein